jgi:hypothetical protein
LAIFNSGFVEKMGSVQVRFRHTASFPALNKRSLKKGINVYQRKADKDRLSKHATPRRETT